MVECAVVNVSNHPIDIRITLVNLGDRRPIDPGVSDFVTYQPGVIPYSSRIRPNTRLVYCKIEVRGIKRKAYKHQVRGSLTWLDTTGPPGSEAPRPKGGASSGQVGLADYRLLRDTCPSSEEDASIGGTAPKPCKNQDLSWGNLSPKPPNEDDIPPRPKDGASCHGLVMGAEGSPWN